MTRVIPKAEVIKNNQKKNLWLLIHDDVYDVTKFLEEHPGGEDTLLEAAGSDATQAFEDVGHSEDARELLRKYKIGTLPDEEKAAHKKTPASANPCTPKSSKRILPSCTKTKTPIDSAHTMTKKEHDRNHNSVSGKSSCSGCNSVESPVQSNKKNKKGNWKWYALAALLIGALAVGALVVKKNS